MSGGDRSNAAPVVATALSVWFVLAFWLGSAGAFVRPPGSAPLPILAAVVIPVLAFLMAVRLSPAFRDFALSVDLRLVTAVHAWRFVGLGFLALHAHGKLPGLFAWPAGLGDIAVSVTAPWMMFALVRRPDFAASRAFVGWNLFGILDFVVALTAGTLGSGLAPGIVGEVTTAPMVSLPLVLIPAFFVPLLTILHLIALYQAFQVGVARYATRARQAIDPDRRTLSARA
jgi:hypothetical protein